MNTKKTPNETPSKVIKRGKEYYRKIIKTADGKRKEFTAQTIAEVERKVIEYQMAEERGEVVTSNTVAVKVWAKEWLETYKKNEVGSHTYQNCKGCMNRYVLPYIGDMRLKDVRNVHLQKVMNNEECSASQKRVVKNVIVGMFVTAYDNRLIAFNPAEKLKMTKYEPGDKRRSLTLEEEKAFLALLPTHKHGAELLCMYYCGLRPGEVAALQCADVDTDKMLISVTKGCKAGTKELKTPKTKAGIRQVPIPTDYLPILQKAIDGKRDEDFVFLNRNGEQISGETIRRHFRTVTKKIKDKEIVEYWKEHPLDAYCLRHTYCTNLQKAGVSLNVAKYLMGHKSLEVTARTYTHQTDDQTDAARQAIDVFNKSKV